MSQNPQPAGQRLRLRYSALSDTGRVRKDNQDSGYASARLLVVADGVGGAARGDLASSTAVHSLRRLDAPPPPHLLEALAGAVLRASTRIGELVEEDPGLEGTSTTVTAALFDGERLGMAHVGDSRGYLLHNGELRRLTRDHTFVQSLIDDHRITEEQSRNHPHRNVILRAVDGVHEADPDLFLVDVAAGDRVLLCSDGCSGTLDDDRIAALLAQDTVDYATVALVQAALEAGSTDNVTVVVADVVGATEDAATGTTAGAVMSRAADETDASASTGPMLVGAAAEQPRPRSPGADDGTTAGAAGMPSPVEDTSELDPVPGDPNGASQTRSADPEELRYAPRPPRRFLWLRRLGLLAASLAVLALIAAVGYRWTQQQYYVAAHGDTVAVFRGVEADIPGVRLSSVFQATDVALASLPVFPAAQVRAGIRADNLSDAEVIVTRLGTLADACTPSPTPSTSATPSSAPSTKPSATASPQASPSPSGGGPASAGAAPSAAASTSPSKSSATTSLPPDCPEATP